MQKLMFLSLSTAMMFFGCGNRESTSPSVASSSQSQAAVLVDTNSTSGDRSLDTLVSLEFRGREYRFYVARGDWIRELYDDFQCFLTEQGYSTSISLGRCRVEDFDGDAIPDTLVTSIQPTHDGSLLRQIIIRSNGDTLFRGSWEITDDRGNPENVWGNNSVYQVFKPYSCFYRAAQETLLVMGPEEFDGYRSFAPDYVGEYRGKLLSVSEFVERHIDFFDPVKGKFVLLYSP